MLVQDPPKFSDKENFGGGVRNWTGVLKQPNKSRYMLSPAFQLKLITPCGAGYYKP